MRLPTTWIAKHKWIDQEIERLDPGTDYAQIWRLANAYRINEFAMNFFYAYVAAHFFSTPQGGRTVVRAGKGKVLENQDKRFSDTNRHTLTWWENNPVSAETRRSVGAVNKLHIHYAKQYPDDMTNNDDYIYGLCTEAAAFHRFREMIGLPGYTSAMQVTAYRFWSDMVPLFQSGDGAALTGWPADFQGVLDVMAKFESRSWPYTEDSVIACEAVRKQFAERYFPRPLQGLGRTMVLAMYPEHVLKTLRLKAPNRFIVRAVRAALKANILLQERVLPDPRETISERLMAKGSPSAGVLGVGACPYVPEASPVRQDR